MDNRTLTEQSAQKLIDYIMENDLSTGAKLPNEFELAGLLGVGRSTLREAVKSLVTRNVLEVRQGAGTFVAERRLGVADDLLGFTFIKDKKKLIMDLLEMRMAIEPCIAATAANEATAEDVAEMRELCWQVEKRIEANEDHMEPDIAFHVKLAESSRNLVVPNLMPMIQNAISLFVNVTNRQLREETIETHRMIVDAVEQRDPLAASDAMFMHIIYNRNNLRKTFREAEREKQTQEDYE